MKNTHWMVLFLIACVIIACQSPVIGELLTRSGDVLFKDDFVDASSGWERASGAGGAMDYYAGGFRIWVSLPNFDIWTTPGLDFNDVRIEVDAARLGGPEANRYGVICRSLDAQNFYFFVISTDGYYGIGKVRGGVRSLLGQEMMLYHPAIHPGIAPNHLRADCIGDLLAIYVNEQPVGITYDDEFTHGGVGLLAGSFGQAGVDVLFDSFVVYRP